MRIHLKYLQWLFFWFSVCSPLPSMAADVAAGVPVTGLPAFAPSSRVQDFPSTEPTFETLRDAGTIDNKIITALVQDAHGQLWIGTFGGLICYDGYRFRKFSHKLGDPFSLAGDNVSSLYAALDGRLWVGPVNDGISVFDPTSERFEHFRHDKKEPGSLSDGRISDLVSAGCGWVPGVRAYNA